MALNRVFKQFNQTINIRQPTSVTTAGDRVYGAAAIEAAARVEFTRDVVETSPGNFRETSHKIATQAAITMDSRIWLPGDSPGDDTLAREPASVDIAIKRDGTESHREVLI